MSLPSSLHPPCSFIPLFYSRTKGVWKRKIWITDGQTADGKGRDSCIYERSLEKTSSVLNFTWGIIKYQKLCMTISPTTSNHVSAPRVHIWNETGMHTCITQPDDRPNVSYSSVPYWHEDMPNPCLYAWKAGRSKNAWLSFSELGVGSSHRDAALLISYLESFEILSCGETEKTDKAFNYISILKGRDG